MDQKEKKKFYNSSAWKQKREQILRRDHYECQDCRARIQKAVKENMLLPMAERRIRRAQEVHHIQELEEHPELALDNDNLISLCILCHNIRHGREAKPFAKKKEPLTKERW